MQFEAAITNKRLPFLKRMIDRRYFTRASFYSGIPSTTPAVQAEVMYGVKGAVPAFQFLHRETGRVFSMYDSEAAKTIVTEELSEAEPLLKGGVSFSNIYSGGSDEARCCAESAELASVFNGVIKDIVKTAWRAGARDYEVVVFSDHGQEAARVYEFEFGQTVQQAVTEALQDGPLAKHIVRNIDTAIKRGGSMDQNMRRLLKIRRGRVYAASITAQELAQQVIVTAMGPIGHVYFPVPVTDDAKAAAARRLVNQHHVPLAVYKTQAGNVMARNASGLWRLADEVQAVCGPHHRFAAEVQTDLTELFDSPNIGDLVLCGWDPEQPPVTFAHENGAHGSIGSQETCGFSLLPTALAIQPRTTVGGEAFIRGVDLHTAGLEFLRSKQSARQSNRASPLAKRESPANRLRVMTYNTHYCTGMDGKCRPQRIADVIAASAADVVALQEMDSNRARTSFRDQAADIAAQLDMHHRFFPVWMDKDERYGLAVLSRKPIQAVQEAILTAADHRTRREARGAIWVAAETDEGLVHVINTHLGLQRGERLRQVEELLSDRWLADIEVREPVVICGDFNAGPKSDVMKRLTQHFNCAQTMTNGHRPQATFASVLPLRQLDFILLSSHFVVKSVEVVRNHATSVASDHLPVLAEIAVR